MPDLAREFMQKQLPDERLESFAHRLNEWLVSEMNRSNEDVPGFTESRARALLRAANVIDDPTLNDFGQLVESETAVRLALYDLLRETGLAENEELHALAAAPATQLPNYPITWLSLSLAAFAWKREYPLYQLDPSAPPGEHSPAGQLVRRAATFIRQQVQRTATERDKLARKLAFDAAAGAHSLDALSAQQPIAPLPPHFRPPIPVRYPEVARETLHVEPPETDTPPPRRTDPITITPDELPDNPQRPVTMPPIRISEEQVSPPTPRRETPPAPVASRGTAAPRRGREPMKTTKLRVLVQEYPDGPGLYGLQVRITSQGVKSHVAGATNREGIFLAELPVPLHSGLTYDVDVTWPRDVGGDTERKSITLNTDRTEFTLPFYLRLSSP